MGMKLLVTQLPKVHVAIELLKRCEQASFNNDFGENSLSYAFVSPTYRKNASLIELMICAKQSLCLSM